MSVSNRVKGVVGAIGALGTIYTAVDIFTFYEVFHRDSKLPGKINEKKKRRVSSSIRKKDDALASWTRTRKWESVEIYTTKNKRLQGWYYPAEKESKTFVLCSHGYRNRGRGEFRFVSKFHNECGHNLLVVDHPAAGDSDGKIITFGKKESECLILWIEYLKREFGDDIKIILHGISMGAVATMLLSSDNRILPNVKFIISDCGFSTLENQFKSVLKNVGFPRFPLMYSVMSTFKLITGISLKSIKPVEQVKKSLVPILFIHGGRDNFVPTEMVYELYNACTSDKDLLVVNGAGHTASYKKNQTEYERRVLTFIERYC